MDFTGRPQARRKQPGGRTLRAERRRSANFTIVDCGRLLSHLRTGRLGAEKFLARRSGGLLGAVDYEHLGSVAWIPGMENPADGLTEGKSETGPLLTLLGKVGKKKGGRRAKQERRKKEEKERKKERQKEKQEERQKEERKKATGGLVRSPQEGAQRL